MKNNICFFVALTFLLLTGFVTLPVAIAQDKTQTSVTVPLYVELNRPFIDLEFKRPDGSLRKARFWVDTGGGGFIMTESLAKELNIKTGEVYSEGGDKYAPAEPPEVTVGGMPLNLKGGRAIVAIGQKTLMPGVNAEGLFPGHILRRYHVIFDYPGRKFTLATPGTIKPRGVQLPSPIGRTGFPRIELSIGGESIGFLLDTGASYTMMSQELLTRWTEQHPEWKRVTGAVGAANMGLGVMEAKGLQVRIPDARLATFNLKDFGVISRPKGTFESFMSRMMTSPIAGAIGGNVLSIFRIEIDYANGVTYLEKKVEINPLDTDMVGLTLLAKADGSYAIVGISTQSDKAVIDSIKPNDKLIKVDKLDVANQPVSKVIDSLRGKPGDKHTLVLERDGKSFTVVAPVTRIL